MRLLNPFRRNGHEQEISESELDNDRIDWVSLDEGRELLDSQARKYLNMSGEEFRRQYRAGLLDRENSDMVRVSYLLPFAEFPVNAQKK